MKLLRRYLGVLWTFSAAAPLATPVEAGGAPGVVGVSAPGRGPGPESRASLGAVRIGLGESVLRDLKTPFTGTPSFRLELTSSDIGLHDQPVSPSGSQAVRRSEQARAPPALT